MILTSQQARTESERCLQCFEAPCTEKCPAHIDIPKFISMIKSGNVRGSAEVVKTSNALANVCGRVCPEEIFCQSVCNRAKADTPIQIRELHYFATGEERRQGFSQTLRFRRGGKKVAVIGAGPAGLGCAFELSKLGYEAHVYEKTGLGGVPRNSIPAFRLPGDDLLGDVEFLSSYFRVHPLEVTTGTLDKIRQDHAAVFLAVGLGIDKRIGISGEYLKGVYPVLGFLEHAKRHQGVKSVGDHVLIIGGGNVSLDAAATAKRLGAREVTVLYRRSEREMKVWRSELREARHQGVSFRFLISPVEILGDENVEGLLCRRNRLSGEIDSSGRPRPVEVPGTDFVLDADSVIVAIGQEIRSDIAALFERTKQGYVRVNDRFQTSTDGVFAGGDAIAGEGTIVQSVAHGKQAAHSIDEYLKSKP